MSKLAKKPIVIPQGIEVKLNDGVLEFSGKEGKLMIKVLPYVGVEIKDGNLQIKALQTIKQGRANVGTMASLIKNALTGVTQGFNKNLELEGIGFKVSLEGTNLVVTAGYSHPVKYAIPSEIKINVEKNVIKITGADKALVGLVAAQIRKIYPPEPYKGKGIKYQGEVIRRKVGKKVAGAGTAA